MEKRESSKNIYWNVPVGILAHSSYYLLAWSGVCVIEATGKAVLCCCGAVLLLWTTAAAAEQRLYYAPGITYTYNKSNAAPGTRHYNVCFSNLCYVYIYYMYN